MCDCQEFIQNRFPGVKTGPKVNTKIYITQAKGAYKLLHFSFFIFGIATVKIYINANVLFHYFILECFFFL